MSGWPTATLGEVFEIARGGSPRPIDSFITDDPSGINWIMIAAQVSSQPIEPAFLQHVWNSNEVRRQIESLARTTNGTYKVNQTVLEGISFMLPPARFQQEFSRRVSAIGEIRKRCAESLAKLEALFRTLQHRAFTGALVT